MIPISNPTNAAEIIDNSQAIRKRLMGPQERARPSEPVKPPAIIVVYRDKAPKDAHVRAYRQYLADQGNKPLAHLKSRCAELGITLKQIRNNSRVASLVRPRQLLMWEIKTQVAPEMSWPAIGRLFGGKNHATVIHAVRKVAAQKEEAP